MISTLDFIVIFLYLFIVLVIGIIASKREHLDGYFVNKRKTKLFLLTFSNVSTLVGAGAVVTVASAAYTSGISYGLMNIIGLIAAPLIFVGLSYKIKQFGDKHKAYTTGDFLEYRFGKKTKNIFSFFYIFLALMWGAIQFVAIAQLLKTLTGISFTFALVASALVCIIYTSIAGIISDILTDFFQFWVMLLTFLFLIPLAWIKADGLNALSSLPNTYYDPLAFGGLGFLIGGALLAGLVLVPSVHYWQRIYSAESVQTSRKSFIFSIPLVIVFVVASILAGLLAVNIVPEVDADGSLFALMERVLPSGLLGLGFAGIIAVVMSSIDSVMLGGSATILKNLYMPLFHPKMHEHELLNMARYITVIFGLITIGVAFLFQDIVKLSLLTAFTALCFVPTILGGLFWKRATSKGAASSLIVSLIVLYSLVKFMPKTAFMPSFAAGLVVLVAVSLFTKHSGNENYTD